MQKSRFTSSIFVLFFLVISSCAFFTFAQTNNSNQNIFLDSDQDGLSDAEEKSYGTDPQNADTDGDSYSDGAEVNGGYNPLKPAPGDKIGVSAVPAQTEEIPLALTAEEENLTKQLEAKIIEAYTLSDDPTAQQEIITQANTFANDILTTSFDNDSLNDLSPITISDIKIKKQNYDSLSEEEKKAKLKEDGISYLTALSYIIYSNMPTGTDPANLEMTIIQLASQAIASQDSTSLNELATNGEKILSQVKELEVPQDLADLDLKILQMMQYSLSLKDKISSVSNDPLQDLQNLSQLEGFISLTQSILPEMSQKFIDYGISFTDVQASLASSGITLPDEQTLNKSITSLTNTTAD